MTLSFTVPGQPQGKARPRFVRRGAYVGTYTPEQTAAYERTVQMAFIEAHGRMMLHGTITAIIRAYFSLPKSLSKAKRLALQGSRMAKKPDADNMTKAILDALNGLAFADDGSIASLRVDKFYTDTDTAPRVEITLVDDQ